MMRPSPTIFLTHVGHLCHPVLTPAAGSFSPWPTSTGIGGPLHRNTQVRQLIAENPGASRRRLSEKLCEVWQWKQANGALRDMVCRGLLLMLHRAGEIELPPIRFQAPNPFVRRATPAPMLIDTTPITSALRELQPIELQ